MAGRFFMLSRLGNAQKRMRKKTSISGIFKEQKCKARMKNQSPPVINNSKNSRGIYNFWLFAKIFCIFIKDHPRGMERSNSIKFWRTDVLTRTPSARKLTHTIKTIVIVQPPMLWLSHTYFFCREWPSKQVLFPTKTNLLTPKNRLFFMHRNHPN